MTELETLYEKYHVISDGFQRLYIVDVRDRKFDLEYSTPVQLTIDVPWGWERSGPSDCWAKKTFRQRSWVRLLEEFVRYLQAKAHTDENYLIAYRTDWSKAPIFSSKKTIDNMVQISDSLFFSVNHTAVHSAWIIGDLLELWELRGGTLIIHRAPAGEPAEIREAIGKIRRAEFKNYLIDEQLKTPEKAEKIIKNVEVLNKILAKTGTSFNDFFLIDNTRDLATYKSKLLKEIGSSPNWNETQIAVAKYTLDMVTAFYRQLAKKVKKENFLIWEDE